MHARKIAVSLFALTFGLTFAGFAGAAADAPAADAPQEVTKACCKHHDGAGDKTGMHCDPAKMKGEGEKGEGCCAHHAAMHKEGADGKAACAHPAGMKKGEAAADGKACCAQHAKSMKDGDKAGCCCCDDGEACPHAAPAAAPAKT